MRSLIKTAIIGATAYLNATRANGEPVSVAEMQIPAATPHMITIDVKLIEVSRKKMRGLEISLAQYDGNQVKESAGLESFDRVPTTAMNGFVDALIENRVARILSNPRLATLEHQEASLSIGLQVEKGSPGAPHYVQRGSRLSVAPKLLENDSVRIDFSLEWSGNLPADSEKETKITRNFEIRTSIISPLGQSTLLT